jgi:hypothetical protein
MARFFPKLNKHKFKYVGEADEYISDEPSDCYIKFDIKNDLTTINLDYVEGFNLDELVSLLIPMATGEIIGPIFDVIAGTRTAEDVEYIKQNLTKRLIELRDRAKQDEGDDPPIVEPINTFIHIMTMNSQGSEE